jgi:hypothetical protein
MSLIESNIRFNLLRGSSETDIKIRNEKTKCNVKETRYEKDKSIIMHKHYLHIKEYRVCEKKKSYAQH